MGNSFRERRGSAAANIMEIATVTANGSAVEWQAIYARDGESIRANVADIFR
jgi:hypothetical protein